MAFDGFPQLYDRACTFEIGTVQIQNLRGDGLDMAGTVQRTNNPEPDAATVQIWNLSRETLNKLLAEYWTAREPGFFRPFQLRVFVGYGGKVVPLFRGDVLDFRGPIRDGAADQYVEIVAEDGGAAYRTGFINQSIAGIDQLTLAKTIASQMGVTIAADAEAALAAAVPGSTISTYEHGVVMQESARQAMDRVARELGGKWWIRDGQIRFARTVTTDFAVVLNPNTGLLSHERVRVGEINVHALLQPQIFPGRQLLVQDARGAAIGEPAYRVESSGYQFATWGGPWYVDAYAKGVRLL